MKLADFILSHDGDDLAALALARGRYAGEVPDFDLALTTLEVRRKLRDKVPQWHAVPSLVYPLRISGEQCSSSATARYKASVALAASQQALLTENACCHVPPDAVASTFGPKCLPSGMARGGKRIADLTGGLGVDSWAFSTPLWRAFSRASRMAESTESTPVTFAAPRLAATRPIVPVPQ